MANNYNSNPIYLDTDIASGWRALQTLNTGNLPANAQQVSGAVARQWGVQVIKVSLILVGAQGAGTVLVSDPNDSAILLKIPITASGAFTNEFDFVNAAKWRDFKVTGLTATGTAMQIWYR